MKNETEHVQNVHDFTIENRFDSAVAGYAPAEIEFLRTLAKTSAFISTWRHVKQACDALSDLDAGKQLRNALRQIGPVGRERLEHGGVSGDDFLQMSLILLLPTAPREREDLVQACREYGREHARTYAATLSTALRGSASGEALRLVLGLSGDTLRQCAERAGVSHMAVKKQAARIQGKIRGVYKTEADAA